MTSKNRIAGIGEFDPIRPKEPVKQDEAGDSPGDIDSGKQAH